MPTPKRDHLIQVASELFCRHGFHATGIDRLLGAAGVAKMTLYKHFGSKEELIVACLQEMAKQSRQALEAHLEAFGGSPQEQLVEAIGWYAEQADSGTFAGCPFHHAQAEYSDPSQAPLQAAREYKQWTRRYLGELAQAAGVPDAEATADSLALVLEGVLASGPMRSVEDLPGAARSLAARLVGL